MTKDTWLLLLKAGVTIAAGYAGPLGPAILSAAENAIATTKAVRLTLSDSGLTVDLIDEQGQAIAARTTSEIDTWIAAHTPKV